MGFGLGAALGGVTAGLGLIGRSNNKDDSGKYYADALNEFSKIKQPTLEELTVQLNDLIQQGIITPEEARAVYQEKSAYETTNVPETGRNAELDALESITKIAKAGGLTANDRASMREIQDNVNTVNRGNQNAILENAEQRGVGGSGVSLAAQLLSQQNSGNEASKAALTTAKMAEDRALEAIINQSKMGSDIGSSDWERASKTAEAKDIINRFNTENQQEAINRNVAARNAAATSNLAEKQRVSDYNIQNKNSNATRTADMRQQIFNNSMDVAKSKAGINTEQANTAKEKYMQNENFYGNLIGGGGQMIASDYTPSKKKVPATSSGAGY